MKCTPHQQLKRVLFLFLLLTLCGGSARAALAQSTTFTYQGRLNDNGAPADGIYDFQFKLFDSANLQQGLTLTRDDVVVASGAFTLQLDFGDVFDGSARLLEIAVRPGASTEAFTTLSPPQAVTATPYAIRSLNAANATQLGGVAASNFVQASSNGNVGIGTTNPETKLTVQTATDDYGITHTDGTISLRTYLGLGAGWFGTSTNHPLYFFTNDTVRMFITASGNVGIGAANPATKMQINGHLTLEAGTNPILYTSTSNTEQNRHLALINSPGFASAAGLRAGGILVADSYSFANPGKNDLIVKGNIGIGTATPLSRLHVHSSGSVSPIFLSTGSGSEGAATFRFQADSGLFGQGRSLVIYDDVAAQYRLIINGSGGVGIGTTAITQAKLQVDGGNINGVYGGSSVRGVWGDSTGTNGSGVHGSGSGSGGYGVYGLATGGSNSTGVFGESTSNQGFGVFGRSPNHGVWGRTTGTGQAVRGDNGGSNSVGYAGYFFGRVNVTGDLTKGSGAFKIDHPLDPENKYLLHSFVESPDMMNIYNGNVTTDENGEATIKLPAWFEALNKDFRYQLTVIGQFAQAIVGSKIQQNRFRIKTDKAHVEVSWQVTGIRRDAYAEANRIQVEQEKPESERGSYLHPQAFGQPEEKSLEWARQPELTRRMKAEREQAKQKPQND